jgi:uncharacterized protein (TIRG00374 family)
MKKKYEIVFFVVGIIIIMIMLYNLGWTALVTNLHKVGWAIILVIFVRFLVYPLNTLAWRAVTFHNKQERKQISFLRMFRLTISGYAINYITPFMALGGEPYRILAIKDELGTKKATSSVLTYVMMHVLSHFVFWILGFSLLIIFELHKVPMFVYWGSVVFIFISLIAIALIIKGYKNGVVVSFFKLLCKIPYLRIYVKKKMSEEFSNTINEIDTQMTDLFNNHRSSFYLSLFYETLSRIVLCLEIFVILWAVGVGIDAIDSIIISTETTLIANIVFIFPMQVGIREGGLAFSFASMGLGENLGVFTGVVMRISELVWIILGVGMIKMKRFGKYNKIEQGKDL